MMRVNDLEGDAGQFLGGELRRYEGKHAGRVGHETAIVLYRQFSCCRFLC